MINKLVNKIQKLNAPVVVGLDPMLNYVPEHIQKKAFDEYGETLEGAAEAIWEFNKEIIDKTYDLIPAVKPQIAMYEQFGIEGLKAYKKTVDYCKEKDLKLMKILDKAGKDHRKYMRMIQVYMDIVAPFYWWKEADTYKVGVTCNSCSTMHKLTAKEFSLNDFSCEKLDSRGLKNLCDTVNLLNELREDYLETNDKNIWDNMIQLLPTSYNQRRTLLLNYEVLANMYHSRKNHKLDEWKEFCEVIKELPYSFLITGEFSLED